MKRLRSYLSGKTHLVWDWNGTLLDDVDICVETLSTLLSRYGMPAMDRDTYRRLFHFPVIEFYKKIGFDFDKHPFEKVGTEFIEIYREKAHGCRLHSGTAEILAELRDEGLTHHVLSAAQESDLLAMLRTHGIHEFFEEVFGLGDHYAHSKVDRGHQLLEKLGASSATIRREEVLMIGDTDHDLEVAQALGIDIVLMADGHQHLERLTAVHHMVIDARLPSSK